MKNLVIILIILALVMFMTNPNENDFSQYVYEQVEEDVEYNFIKGACHMSL